ncbi:MAG TPA: hypothetical protein VFE45_04645 [Coriobacteriia bacterium]|jgi:hypothetical protein|nr:hypothetical protein [Coriobacteriia bacterium]
MINIDLPTDLNFVDDDGMNLARAPEAGPPTTSAVVVAGTPTAWSSAVVEDVAEGWVRFRSVTARETARHGSLVAG